ncbi:MAG: hypothetical protein EOP39_04620 [Rubrivivax sp.]|nr:MAG: hypothetical protein EOP39_04620 [Rubrivivax sp.]
MAKTPKAKFKLGDRPEAFPIIKVAFKTNRGQDAEIEAVFEYRTREEFGAFVAEQFSSDGTELPRTTDGQIDFEAMAKRSTSNDATYLKGALKSWDLEDDLSVKSLQQLCNEQPAAMVALKQAYANACNEGRLGN